MISQHLANADIERYRARTLPAEELLAATEHVFACDVCHRRLSGAKGLERAYRFLKNELQTAAMEHSEHLRFEQVVAYASDQLEESDREILETHIEECADCDAEVADIRLFRATLLLIPPRGPAPKAERKQRWLSSGWRTLYQAPLQIAAMLVIAALVAWI